MDGTALDDQFGGQTGRAIVTPGEVAYSGAAGPGSATVTIESELPLDGFVAEGFGFGSATTTVESVNQDNPNDPGTASFMTTVDIEHAALLAVSTANSGAGSDIDLYVLAPDVSVVGASTTPTDAEEVVTFFPEDGTYTVAVHGWSVPTGTDTFELTINAVQGYDITVTDAPASILAGGSGELTVEWDTTGFAPGTYEGAVLTGPADAPGLIQIPAVVTVN